MQALSTREIINVSITATTKKDRTLYHTYGVSLLIITTCRYRRYIPDKLYKQYNTPGTTTVLSSYIPDNELLRGTIVNRTKYC